MGNVDCFPLGIMVKLASSTTSIITMKNNKSSWFVGIAIIFLVLLCTGVTLINSIFDPLADFVYRSPHFAEASDTGKYQIDPQTILTSLENHETNVFVPAITTSDVSVDQDQILWWQSEYLTIADAVFDAQWTDQYDGWYLSFVFFEANCQDFSKGFYGATFNYYKENWRGMELRYLGRQINISPRYHEIEWSGDAYYYPPLFYFEKNIDLNALPIGANHAIDIAEENGGSAVRLEANNQCSIWVTLDGNEKRGWEVSYEGDNNMLIDFDIYINPYTGKISKK